jgi:hypothetical protein
MRAKKSKREREKEKAQTDKMTEVNSWNSKKACVCMCESVPT